MIGIWYPCAVFLYKSAYDNMIACWSVTQVAWVQSQDEVLIFFFIFYTVTRASTDFFPYAVSMIPTSAVRELLSYCQAYNYTRDVRNELLIVL